MIIKRLSLFLLVFWGIVPSWAAAEDDYLDLNLEQLLQVTVTGSTLRNESLKTVPSAVTVFTHEQISVLGMDYLHELLSLVPDYQSNRHADNAVNYTYSARGRRNAAQSREILLVVDGRLFVNPRTGSSDIVVPLFPLAQIERVEVIRGPGSAIYGSSAFSGVINVVTRKRTDMVKVSAGSDQQRSMDLLWGHEQGDWETSLFAHAYADNGQNFTVRDISSVADEQTSDPINSSTNLDFGLRYQRTQIRIAYNRTDSNDFYEIERISNGYNESTQEFSQFSLEQGFNPVDAITSTLAFSYTYGDQLLKVETANEGELLAHGRALTTAPFLTQANLEGESYRVALANDWNINELVSSQFGIELREDTEVYARGLSNYDLAQYIAHDYPIDYYGSVSHLNLLGTEESQQSIGVYGQYLQQFTTGTNLTLGLRYDNYKDIADHFSPRLGLVQQLTDTQTLKLLYGEAFRAPTFSETGIMNNTRVVGNPNLTHEVVKTWDLIWMVNWQNSSLSLDGFHSHYEQPISTGLVGATRTFINGGSEESNGVSLEASRQLSSNWLARITYSHFLELPDSAFREADQLASLMLDYNYQSWNWNLTAAYQSACETLTPVSVLNVLDTFERNTIDDYWVVNSKLVYQVNAAVDINLQAKNLLDEEYATPAQGNGIEEGVPNRGQEWSLGLDWRW